MNFDGSSFLWATFATIAVTAIVIVVARKTTKLSPLPVVLLALVGLLGINPAIFSIWTNASRSDITNYHEFWNGLEKSYNVQKTTCSRDGDCENTYECDPYEVPETRTRTYTDSKGNTQTETYVVWVTEYHHCPYVTEEYTYTVTDTMGVTYTFGDHWFPANPEQHRFRNTSLPNIPSGVPSNWQAAKDRIDSGNPGGTTRIHTYKNYVLASQTNIYKKYSDKIDTFRKDNLLPKLASSTSGLYDANKVYQAGTNLTDLDAWEAAAQRFNGYFAAKQGDLHVVLVNADQVTDPDAYTSALNSYWLDTKSMGKNTLSKNGVVVVLGVSKNAPAAPAKPSNGLPTSIPTSLASSTPTAQKPVDQPTADGNYLVWSRGFTGMPTGNEDVVVNLNNLATTSLAKTSLTPSILFATDGEMGKILMNGYKRVKMADYAYLEKSIPASSGSDFDMGFVAVLLSSMLILGGSWGLEAYRDTLFSDRRGRGSAGSLEAFLTAGTEMPSVTPKQKKEKSVAAVKPKTDNEQSTVSRARVSELRRRQALRNVTKLTHNSDDDDDFNF